MSSGVGRWLRIASGIFANVKWFGAVGNGVADDTASIQVAINFVVAQNGSRVFFQSASQYYKTSSPIIVAGPCVIEGSNSPYLRYGLLGHGAIIKTSSTTTDIFRVTVPVQPVRFESLTLGCEGVPSAGAFIHFISSDLTQACANCECRDVEFDFPWVGINGETISTCRIDGCRFDGVQGIGIIVSNTHNVDSGDNTIENCFFDLSAAGYAVKYVSASGLRVLNNKFINGHTAFLMSSTTGITFAGGQLIVTGNSFDGQTNYCLRFQQANLADICENVIITGNNFDNYSNTVNDVRQISFEGNGMADYKEVSITGNIFHYVLANGTKCIELANAASRVFISTNSIYGDAAATAVTVGAGVTHSGVTNNIIVGFGSTVTNASGSTTVSGNISP